MLAAEIVFLMVDELADRKGLNLEELVNDEDIYEELLNDLIEAVDERLFRAMDNFLGLD